MNYIQVNFTINTCCLIFLIFLIVIYLSKKNANNIDNKIYKQLLFWNLLMLIFNGAYPLCFIIFGENNISYFLCRIYGSSYFIYFLFLVIYILINSLQHSKKFINFMEKNYKVCLFGLILLIIVICAPMFFLPFDFDIREEELFASGILSIYQSSMFAIEALCAFAIIILNLSHLDKTKLIPFAVLGILSALSIIIVAFLPSLVSLVFDCTLITYLMYHTIENPDMKMVNELTLAKDSAEKASRAKSEFLSSMSHELKTPLNAIIGFSNVIKESNDIDNIHSDIDEVINSSNKLLDMVDSILNVNQLDNNNLEVINTKYDLSTIVLNINDNLEYRIKEKNLNYTYNISNNIPKTLYGDSGKIKTIITNLLSNAVKYTDNGAINLDINCLNNKDDCILTITVSDTGRGISDEQRESLFEKFNRLDSDKDSDIEGAGLGLNITKSLVDLLDGDISVSSILGEGSTFTVKIKQKMIINNDKEIL